jgi:DNA-binding NarL/FixJ family response regulator
VSPIRVLLADDHTMVRAGFRSLIEGMQGFEVVAEAADGREALELAERLRPDVVLSDIAMPELGGLELTSRLAEAVPEARVLILSMHRDPGYVRQAVRSGARGYLLKSSGPEELEQALLAVARGEAYFTPSAAAPLADALRDGDRPAELTRRQVEVLRLVASGRSNKQVALALGLSIKTVETHRAQLMERLGVREVAGLVRYAIEHGLADPPPGP